MLPWAVWLNFSECWIQMQSNWRMVKKHGEFWLMFLMLIFLIITEYAQKFRHNCLGMIYINFELNVEFREIYFTVTQVLIKRVAILFIWAWRFVSGSYFYFQKFIKQLFSGY